MSTETDVFQFATELQQQVIGRCEMEGDEGFRESAFTELMLESLGDAGELDDAVVCLHHAHGIQVNGYAISENEECLDLIVALHTDEVPPRTVARDEQTSVLKRLINFFEKARTGYHRSIEESTAVFDLTQKMYEIRPSLTRVRLFLVTDGLVKADPPKDRDAGDIHVSFHVWDIERFYRCWSSGRRRETIEIDFEEMLGSPIPCLTQPSSNSEYSTYLAILPGRAIVELYSQHGPRLLERNVRSFLQAKGAINRGIRNTIRSEPHMFLAFNNGLSVTAEAVTLADLPGGGKGIRTIRDLQIVNGGQTTASIYHAAKRDRVDVSGIAVQAKLTVLNDPAKMDFVVPKISAFANSQNKIQAADLEANNAYHRRIEELSRTIWASARDGSQRQTRWYYERARGQFQDDLARERTPARQRDFLATHPKVQQFTKTDLAKYVYTWGQLPHIVSRGAQTCFSHFTNQLEAHVKAEGAVDDAFFHRLIARAILFRTAERIMRECSYSGYRANLVTYTIARLVRDTKAKINLDKIWREQKISSAVEEAMRSYSKAVWDHITNPPGSGNVTQYCKREECWTTFINTELRLPRALYEEVSSAAVEDAGVATGRSGPRTTARSEFVRQIMDVPSDTWFQLVSWAREHGHFNEFDRSLACDLAVNVGYSKEPTPRQATDGLRILATARKLGFLG